MMIMETRHEGKFKLVALLGFWYKVLNENYYHASEISVTLAEPKP
jgi:hypothetical protein